MHIISVPKRLETPMDKKFSPVTDPAEIEEILEKVGELNTPYPYKPNGHLWVPTDELKDWRDERTGRRG